MAIQWKRTWDYAVNIESNVWGNGTSGNAFGLGSLISNTNNYTGEIILCTAEDKMSDIKSITIANGNGSGIVVWNVYIDTTMLDADSPEYWNLGKKQVFLIRSARIPARSVITFPIDYATWSSNGCVLKMNVKGVSAGNNSSGSYGNPNSGHWMQGSVVLSGNDSPTTSKNINYNMSI